VVALYLVYFKITPSSALCVGAGGCEVVNASVYSEIRGIPMVVLGALAYTFLAGLLLFESKFSLLKEWGALAVFGTTLACYILLT